MVNMEMNYSICVLWEYGGELSNVYCGNMEVSYPICVLWEYGGELFNMCIVGI